MNDSCLEPTNFARPLSTPHFTLCLAGKSVPEHFTRPLTSLVKAMDIIQQHFF